ncbi:hypothetical protein GE061_016549 [Apolygus lucorum]|uniref:Uncharacterized protein n=1 Tax=Apolygus lucorum TaxID=248454 RepID=A0A6A4JMK9_APOLU|nr:hypothetical protein GE061_016549 [Apolygus lucorum]
MIGMEEEASTMTVDNFILIWLSSYIECGDESSICPTATVWNASQCIRRISTSRIGKPRPAEASSRPAGLSSTAEQCIPRLWGDTEPG